MNNLLRSGKSKIFPAFIFLVTVFTVQASAQLNETLNRVEAHRKALQTLRATIKMGKYDPVLKEWTNNDGKINLIVKSKDVKETSVRIDWKMPEEMLLIKNGRYSAYTLKTRQLVTGDASSSKKAAGAFSFLTMSKAELNANYRTQYMGEEKLAGDISTWHLMFLPKTESKYKNVDIWVDQNGMILQVKMVSTSGDEGYIRLTDLEKNVTIKKSIFDWKPPKDVKEIRG